MPVVIGGAALGLTLLIGLGVLAFSLLRGSSSAAMRYLPHDAEIFASIRMDDIVNHEAAKTFLDDPRAKSMQDELGLGPNDIAQIFVAGTTSDQQPVVVMTTRRPVEPNDLLKTRGGGWKEETVGSQTIHVNGLDAIALPDSNTIVAGRADALKKALAPDRQAGFNARLQSLVDSLSLSKTVAFAMVAPADLKLPPDAPFDPSMLSDFQGLLLEADLGGDLDVRCDVRCKTQEAAQRYHDMVKGMLAMFGGGGPGMPSEAREALQSLQVSVSGSSLIATATVKKSTLTSLAQQAKAMGGM